MVRIKEKQAMKDYYPQSDVWPYVIVGLLLFGMVLSPPDRWPDTAADLVSASTKALRAGRMLSTPKPARRDPPLIIAFDPYAKAPSSEASPKSDFSLWNRQAANPFGRDQTGAGSANLADAPGDDGNLATSPSAEIERYVWQPPPNWVPRPIRPLDAFDSQPASDLAQSPTAASPDRIATTPVVTPQPDPQPVAVTPQPAVAKQVRSHLPPFDRPTSTPLPEGLYPALTQPSPAGLSHSESHHDLPADPIAPQRDAAPSIGPAKSADRDANRTDLPEKVVDRQVDPQPAPAKEMFEEGETGRTTWPVIAGIKPLLDQGRADRVLENWVEQIEQAIGRLQGSRFAGGSAERDVLERLKLLATFQADRSFWSHDTRVLHNRICQETLKRVAIWEPLTEIAAAASDRQTDEPNVASMSFAKSRLDQTASTLIGQLKANRQTAAWSEYLQLDSLTSASITTPHQSRQAAEITLSKLRGQHLSTAQRQFLSGAAFQPVVDDLRTYIACSITPADVVQALERYEVQQDRDQVNHLIGLLARWRFAPDNTLYMAAINRIISYYRNANFRIAVSEDLINRFVPALHQYAEAVNDTILGAKVRGSNSTRTRFDVKLLPDPEAIRIGLLARGNINSNTTSRKGPVRLFSTGKSTFAAGKELVVRPDGIDISATETRASTGNRITGMQTDWDEYPFIGSIIRGIARQQHEEQRLQLKAEILKRVRRNTSRKIDQEVQDRVANAEARLDEALVNPLRQLQLDPKPLEMRTTDERLILRARLASLEQLGAHTPRPRALADSKLSLQLHQSVPNNWIEQLSLSGRRMNLEELFDALAERFGLELDLIDDRYSDVIIQFADSHPLEFEFDNDQIALTIHLAELRSGNNVWQDFSVRGSYRVDFTELDVELMRDAGIELISDKLRFKDQIALRSIFTKVLARNTKLAMLNKAIQQQPQLQSLVVTQFAVRDGWLAMSLGEKPKNVRMATRPLLRN